MAMLTDDLYRLVQGTDGRACSTWTRLNRFFLNNTMAQYTYLSKAFRNTTHGDMPIFTYATKLQTIVDDLATIGRPVDDADLTMQFLDVGKKFRLQAEILKGSETSVSFSDACLRIQLAEIDDASQQVTESVHALVVHGGGRGQPSGHTAPLRPAGVDPTYFSPNYKGKNPIPGFVHANQASGQGASSSCGTSWRGRGHGAPGGLDDPSGGRVGVQTPWLGYFAPMGTEYTTPRHMWMPTNSNSVLGPRPGPQTHAYPVLQSLAPSVPPQQFSTPLPHHAPSWDQQAMFNHTANYGSAFPAYGGDWIMDSGATSHVTGNPGTLTTSHSPLEHDSQHIIVGNGSRLPVVATGTSYLAPHPFHLNSVLVSPNIVTNLISTRSFVQDNSCSVEFDPFGFYVKDLATREPIMRSNSLGDLYPFYGDHGGSAPSALSITAYLWHKRVGHPSSSAISHVPLDFLSSCNKSSRSNHICDVCQLGKNTKLPFSISHSRATMPFDLIHCDLWTSPIVSCSG
jgi:hypothetical protein